MGSRVKDWLDQALNDLEWGQASAASDFHSQACFIAQQVAEKALKALAYFSAAQSREALAFAERFVEKAQSEMEGTAG